MVVSHVEDLAEEYLRIKGYSVRRNVWYQPPQGEKRVKGWSDIDILAINQNVPDDVLLVQCKTFAGDQSYSKIAPKLRTHFTNAESYIRTFPLYKKANITKVLLVDYPPGSLVGLLEPDIKTVVVEEWLHELLQIMNDRVKKQRIGREDHPMTRILITLVEGGFIKNQVFKLSHEEFVKWLKEKADA